MGMRRLLRQNSVAGPVSWTGSLMQDNQDASGLMYRRNRFYDPKSGPLAPDDHEGVRPAFPPFSARRFYRQPFGAGPKTLDCLMA
jgi:hypothetical protein